MTPQLFITAGILPAYELLPERMTSPAASAMIVAICLQESRFRFRKQIVRYWQGDPIFGPARGYAQFEMGGGIRAVLTHEATRDHVREVLTALNYDHEVLTSYQAIEHNDIVCATYARLLLWSDPAPLPDFGQDETAWEYYLRTWRPGKPHRETWSRFYDEAWRIVGFPKETQE